MITLNRDIKFLSFMDIALEVPVKYVFIKALKAFAIGLIIGMSMGCSSDYQEKWREEVKAMTGYCVVQGYGEAYYDRNSGYSPVSGWFCRSYDVDGSVKVIVNVEYLQHLEKLKEEAS